MVKPSTPFARCLGDIRLRLRLSSADVCKGARVDAKTLYTAEAGARSPRVDIVGRLLGYYNSIEPLTDDEVVKLARTMWEKG